MKIVLLERNSAGTDVPVDCFNELGEVTSYPNTVTAQEVAERVGDADVIVCNKAPMREESLKNCPNVKLICPDALLLVLNFMIPIFWAES